jgi:S1-C subfamily serine protease
MKTLPLDEALAGHLGVEKGALVSEVWNGQRASASGLRPGDVIVELGEHGVSSPDDLQPLLLPPELGTRLARIRRGGKTVELDLTVGSGSGEGTEEGDHGVRLESISGGFVIGSVSPGSPGEVAGLRGGDRILRVDDRVPRNPAELRRALARRRPAFIELERGSRRLGMLLE